MRSYLKHNRSMVFVGMGTILFATSVLWEFSRMNPQFRYLVEPWSLRGFETDQGLVFVIVAVAVLTLAVLITTGVIKETWPHNIGVVAAVTAVATMIPIITDARDATPAWPVTWGMALFAAAAARVIAIRLIPETLRKSLRSLIAFGTFLISFFAAGYLIHSAFGGKETPVWLLVLVFFLFMDLLVLFRDPIELSTYRTLINIGVIGWMLSMAASAAVRVTLQELQFEAMGLRTDIGDIQVTSGMLIAWLGGLLMFIGAVSLWAGRRELLSATQRAHTQIAMARASAEELGEQELRVAADLEEVINS